MSEINCKYYRFGYSGYDFLSVCGSVYTQSEVLPNGIIQEIECDLEMKWMKVRTKHTNESDWLEMNLDGICKKDIIDFSDKGDRWEGDSLNGFPYGYGCIFNEENRIIYKGFMFEGKKVCFGSDYYGDLGTIEYVGDYYKNTRNGNGKLYDKKNECIYDGEWSNNSPLKERSIVVKKGLKEEDIHFGLEEIEIGKDCLDNLECFKLIGFDRLKRLIIHENSLKRMNCFCIEDCNELVCVNFETDNSINNDNDLETSKEKYNKLQRVFRIMNCRNLKDLYVSEGWFRYFNSAEINS